MNHILISLFFLRLNSHLLTFNIFLNSTFNCFGFYSLRIQLRLLNFSQFLSTSIHSPVIGFIILHLCSRGARVKIVNLITKASHPFCFWFFYLLYVLLVYLLLFYFLFFFVEAPFGVLFLFSGTHSRFVVFLF